MRVSAADAQAPGFPRRDNWLPRGAMGWLALVCGLAAFGTAALGAAFPADIDPLTLALLLLAGSAAQARATHVGANQVFHTGLAFTLAAALLLPPAAAVLVCVAQHIPEWLRQRYPWYIQTFNVANATASLLAAWVVFHALGASGSAADGPLRVSAAVGAAAAYVLVNHGLLALMLRFARGHSIQSTGLFGIESLMTDAVLAGVGTMVALLAGVDPWAVPLAALPLVVIHRALAVPALREQARRDPKTELVNARGLDEAAGREFARAARFERPLSLLVIDIDDLRGINNRHGHLAGDAALKTVARLLRERQREYDISARFGGDEFVVVLPETSAVQAGVIKRRLVERIAAEAVVVHDGEEVPVRASIGAATRVPGDANVRDLIRRADGDMYAAKPRPRPAAAVS